MTTSLLLALLAVGSFFHIDLGPHPKAPVTPVPLTWSVSSEDLVRPDTAWWTLFREPVLDGCMREALTNNRDLESAIARVEQSRAALGVTRSDQSPKLDGVASTSRSRVLSPSGSYTGYETETDNNTLYGGASYEWDLWSKLKKATAASRADLLASEAARDSVKLTLEGDVAKAYFNLRGADQQLQISRKTLAARREALALRKLRYEHGYTSELEYRQDQAETAAAEVAVRQYEQQVAQYEHALLLLMGRDPKEMAEMKVQRGVSLDAMPDPPAIPAGLPSQLLERRPDIRQARRELEAAQARVGEAYADRFPSISLTGLFGAASLALGDLFTGPSGWGFGGALTAPILDGGKRKSKQQEAEAKAREALSNYDQSIHKAFKDTLDSLTGTDKTGQIYSSLSNQERAQNRAFDLAKMRYEGGYSDYLDVLDAERTLFQVQLDREGARRDRYNAAVTLCLSLGGGWAASADAAPGTTKN
jgi:multidrug efflux system outer membrane protein